MIRMDAHVLREGLTGELGAVEEGMAGGADSGSSNISMAYETDFSH